MSLTNDSGQSLENGCERSVYDIFEMSVSNSTRLGEETKKILLSLAANGSVEESQSRNRILTWASELVASTR
jgi:hypothetical protein